MTSKEKTEPAVSDHELARLIQEALAELGKEASATEVANRVRRLDIGLTAEDEFSVLCTWLGRCELLHKLDQLQVPSASKQIYQVPDLLARFSSQTNITPLLIEVKSKSDNRLYFKPDYLKKLQNYASLVGMPLLIAWRYRSLWVLFEARHLKQANKNYTITFTDAIKENLLGVLAGDVMYVLEELAGFHISVKKERLIETVGCDDHSIQQWHTVVDEMYFTTGKGLKYYDLDQGVFQLFVTAELDEVQEHSDTHIHLHATAGSHGAQPAYRALVNLLHWESNVNQGLNWRHVLRRDQPLATINDFHALLRAGLTNNIVRFVIEQHPLSPPDFLEPIDSQRVDSSAQRVDISLQKI
ncbi:hypothetical protein [Xanthomonas sp. WHRI 10064B]|nr:hypothetical protein [Xanthomonas sp. WHRI 10064B]